MGEAYLGAGAKERLAMQAGVAEWVAPLVRRILAPNPGPMTGAGTNSYLLGQGGGLVLVDPGPMIEAHVQALLAALDPGERIERIVVTHAHLDHSAAAPRLSALTKAPVLAFGQAQSGRSALMQQLARQGLQGGGEGIDMAFRPDQTLADGARLDLGGAEIEVIHTPGHMGNHICLCLGSTLLSGDHAMGWSTSLVSPPDGDMSAYLQSLDRLRAQDWQTMLPGHGPEVPDPAERLQTLYEHRKHREAQILTALATAPGNARTLAAQIYSDTAPALMPAAARNVLAHLLDLAERSIVEPKGPLQEDTVFSRKSP
jgi:glyoxylase-like metal-dependent hydrolase (beta-lactamase superfamily II)